MSDEEISAMEARSKEYDRKIMAALHEKISAAERDGFTSLSRQDQDKHQFAKLIVIDQNRDVLRQLEVWDPKSSKKGIFLFGSVGTGKSALCKCLINKWASMTYRCKFIGVGTLMETIKSAIDLKESSVQHEMDKFIAYDLLVLDDLGTENGTDWTYEKLFAIMDNRINAGRHTFFTSNFTLPKFLEKYGIRITDRIKANCRTFSMVGKSFRELLNNNDEW